MMPTFHFGCPKFCTYCGDPANGIDHIIPIVYQRVGKRMSADKNTGGPITYACRSCNSIAGDKHFASFDERCRYITSRLNTSAAPVHWTLAELRRLDYTLRTFVIRERNRRLWMRARADWFESRDFLLNIENLLWVPYLDKNSKDFDKFTFDYFEWTFVFIKTIYGD